MNILLDTHIFIWWLKDDKKLSKKARSLIANADEVYISSASIWECAIKVQLEKLDIDINLLTNLILEEGFLELAITAKHAAYIASLQPHHRDPFDRMLIAQAITEPLRLLTSDKTLRQYSQELIELV